MNVTNIFRKYKKVRDSISLIVFGVFLGSFIKAFDSSSIRLDFPIDGYTIIVAIFVLVILSSLVTGFTTNDVNRRGDLHVVAGIAFFVFIFVLMVGIAIRNENLSIEQEKKKLNISEVILLADDNEKRTNYDRAIMHLESVKYRLGIDDPRRKVIEERIKELKLKQVE